MLFIMHVLYFLCAYVMFLCQNEIYVFLLDSGKVNSFANHVGPLITSRPHETRKQSWSLRLNGLFGGKKENNDKGDEKPPSKVSIISFSFFMYTRWMLCGINLIFGHVKHLHMLMNMIFYFKTQCYFLRSGHVSIFHILYMLAYSTYFSHILNWAKFSHSFNHTNLASFWIVNSIAAKHLLTCSN